MYSKLYKNAIKAEQEIIKASISDKPSNWFYGSYTENNRVYDCLTEGPVLVAFTFNTFILNKEIFKTNNKVLNIAQLLDKANELSYEPAQLIGTRLVGDDKKYTCCVLKKSTGEEILFNEKYKKYFTDDVEYRVTDSRSPIKIYNGDVFMGIIMPVMVMKKNKKGILKRVPFFIFKLKLKF